MDLLESAGRSTHRPSYTSDLSYFGDMPTGEGCSKKLISKNLNEIKSIYSFIKSFSNTTDYTSLKIIIDGFFEKNSTDKLCQKLPYRCCNFYNHGSKCSEKWKEVHEEVLQLMSNELSQTKSIFVIKKRKSLGPAILLDKSQPSWVHRLILPSLFSNN